MGGGSRVTTEEPGRQPCGPVMCTPSLMLQLLRERQIVTYVLDPLLSQLLSQQPNDILTPTTSLPPPFLFFF